MRSDHIFIKGVFRDDIVNPNRPIEPGLHLAHRAYSLKHLETRSEIPIMSKSDERVADILESVNSMPH